MSDSATHLLFVYGTLQDPRVIQAVTGRLFPAVPATLRGYCRYRVNDADYPGVREDACASVEGLLLQEVDSASLAALDAFEGEYYQRREVEVVMASGIAGRCFCYVIHEQWLHLLSDEPWTLEEFQSVGYQRFRDTYPKF